MPGALNEILQEPISEQNEKLLNHLLKDKLKTACNIAVELLHAMEAHFGPEVRQVFNSIVENRQFQSHRNPGKAEDDLHVFCDELDQGCVGTHMWERVVDEPDRIGYRYTYCMWAEIFNELGEPDLGFVLCAGDEPAVKAYNPVLGFERTRVLMHGDEDCDHEFFIEGK
jgi:hypothetical protein